MPFVPKYKTVENFGNFKCEGFDGFLFVDYRDLGRQGRPGFTSDPEILNEVCTILAKEGIIYHFYGSPHIKVNGKWGAVSVGNARPYLANAGIVFACGRMPDHWNNDALDCNTLASAVNRQHGLIRVPAPVDLARLLVEGCTYFKEANGVLKHPIAGEIPDSWLTNVLEKVPDPDPSFSHLKQLYSGLPLNPASHCALYSFLLGAFHAVSLTDPRPILFVDSWIRGRGKSDVGAAVSALLDIDPRSLTIKGRQSDFSEKLTAHLITGARTILAPNLDGRANFNSEMLACLSTDEGLSERPKYGRTVASFKGTMCLSNSVLGRVTLHEDLLSRVWRVELAGNTASSLDPNPRHYAPEYRKQIWAEILLAHEQAPEWKQPNLTRFAQFEQKALAAYSHAFGLTQEEAHGRLKDALAQTQALASEPMSKLIKERRELFDNPLTDLNNFRHVRDWTPFAGASAFGLTLQEDGTWKP